MYILHSNCFGNCMQHRHTLSQLPERSECYWCICFHCVKQSAKIFSVLSNAPKDTNQTVKKSNMTKQLHQFSDSSLRGLLSSIIVDHMSTKRKRETNIFFGHAVHGTTSSLAISENKFGNNFLRVQTLHGIFRLQPL